MAARSDSPSVGRHDDEHLRRFLVAREGGDADAMRRAWEELVIAFQPRMNALVYLAHRGRLSDAEHEDAVQRAMTRFTLKLVGTFQGSSMGELVNATKRLCSFAVADVIREAAEYRRRHRSLDQGWNGAPEDDRPAPAWEVDAAREAYEQAEHDTDMDEFLAWALPQVLESRRGVVERTFAGETIEEICAALDVSHPNAYQRRSRGLKDLGKLLKQYDA